MRHGGRRPSTDCAVVCKKSSNTQKNIRLIEDGIGGARAYLAPEDTRKLAVCLGKETFACRLNNNCTANCFRQTYKIFFDVVTSNLGTDNNHYLLFRFDIFGNIGDGSG